jgi:hypothetical protein
MPQPSIGCGILVFVHWLQHSCHPKTVTPFTASTSTAPPTIGTVEKVAAAGAAAAKGVLEDVLGTIMNACRCPFTSMLPTIRPSLLMS